ncbi:hypothetical protein EJ08DRAFT_645454 [Tothia fuscella]|uniref:Pal1 cell morphology n=1 Tax=Tothia fuscella TaxID=1048955 RepID=A0A9P4P1M8_9PEZI|nr:hypothetical protein EJ08DRAFT_645454 [Tothia fuscella]
MAAQDKNWAKGYILDPLTNPDPSDETGLNTHFRSTFAPASPLTTPRNSGTSTSLGSKNPFRNSSEVPSHKSSVPSRGPSHEIPRKAVSSAPSPPHSSTVPPRDSPHRQEAFSSYDSGRSKSGEHGRHASGDYAVRKSGEFEPRTRSRGNSMNQTPLESARHDAMVAHRSAHLKKKHIPGADAIDRLDIGPKYHHEGPFDAVLLARNTSIESSPLAAVRDSNREAIMATPRENIRDSLEKHKPLDGTAIVPPGETDQLGRTFNYREGDNMETSFGGDYKRWPGIKYHPDDIKGKGEPSYSIEKALREHKIKDNEPFTDRGAQGENSGIEMQAPRHGKTSSREEYVELGAGPSVQRSGSNKRNSLDGLKKRIGSLRKKN